MAVPETAVAPDHTERKRIRFCDTPLSADGGGDRRAEQTGEGRQFLPCAGTQHTCHRPFHGIAVGGRSARRCDTEPRVYLDVFVVDIFHLDVIRQPDMGGAKRTRGGLPERGSDGGGKLCAIRWHTGPLGHRLE
jgi:hypothetical protein